VTKTKSVSKLFAVGVQHPMAELGTIGHGCDQELQATRHNAKG